MDARRALLLLMGGGGIKWLLRDEFTDERAAGSVDGTPATPGSGTRTVAADTASAISIGSGSLNIDGGADDWTGTKVGLADGIAVAAGRVVLWHLQQHESRSCVFGLFDATSFSWATAAEAIYRASNGDVGIGYDSSDKYGSLGAFLDASTTKMRGMAIVLGDDRVYWIARDTPSSVWKLYWMTAFALDSPLYWGSITYHNASDNEVPFVRVPDALWLPTPLAYDTFTRANGAVGSSEAIGPDGQTVAARTYTTQSGTWAINTNALEATAAGILTLPSLHADVLFKAKLTLPASGTDPAGIIVRWTNSNNYWYVKVTPGTAGNDLELIELDDGSPTVRGSADVDWSPNGEYFFAVMTDGQTIDVFWDDTREIHYTSAALNETATIYGLRDEANSNFIFDDLVIFPRGTSGEYSRLNRWSS